MRIFLPIYLVLLLRAGGVNADEQQQITEDDLKQYDGTDTEKPIYLAINGTIFDVSASPAFYGPGGHYREAFIAGTCRERC